jgi:hypothetical protein
VVAASWQSPVRDGGTRHREVTLGRGGVREKGRVLRGGQTCAGEGNQARGTRRLLHQSREEKWGRGPGASMKQREKEGGGHSHAM